MPTISELVTTARASSGTYFGPDGLLKTAGNNVLRLDHAPTTGEPRGALIEKAATNYLTNNTMVGAVVGSPGTLPTGWGGTLNGLTREVVGFGLVDGSMEYIDIRYYGTPSPAWATIALGNVTGLFGAGEAGTMSAYIIRYAGSLSNIGRVLLIIRSQPGNVDQTLDITGSITGWLREARHSVTLPDPPGANGSGVAFVSFDGLSGPIDITLRIALPQMERGLFATSPIKTADAQVTRAGDDVYIGTSSFDFNPSAGTFFIDVETPKEDSTEIFHASQFRSFTGWFRVIRQSGNIYFQGQGMGSNYLLGSVSEAGDTCRVAVSYRSDGLTRGSMNGRPAVGSGIWTGGGLVNRFSFGNGPSNNQIGGCMRKFDYYTRAMSDAELEALTS